MGKTFAVIVLYNGMRNNWIQKCIDSILMSSLDVEIIVVDNNSTDGGAMYVRESYPDVILINSDRNLGFGGANNRGVSKALELGAEYVFLLNQDATIQQDTLSNLIDYSRSNPEYGIVSPIHLNGAGDKLDYNFSLQVSPLKCADLFSDALLGQLKPKMYETTFVCAAAWLIPKNTLRIVGGFSPTFFHYGEDDNYCQRVQYFDLKIGVCPESRICHDRENRAVGEHHAKSAIAKRSYLRKLSNPFTDFETNHFLSWLKLQYFKLTKEPVKIELYKYVLSLSKSGELDHIKKNYLLSKDKTEYKFLDL